jgi:EAL domain-containing protein (putative c-di-GMP-specific phosphodiesterase class I)
MYMAKNSGKGRHAVFESRMHTDALERLELESDLRRAVQREEFVLHYQPITDLKTGRIVGMEALVRWQHPERGILPPSYFISHAEETGLILPLGRLVLQQACAQITDWNCRHPEERPLFVSVNLSGKQLESPTLVEDVAAVLEESGIDPATLILEMTESVMMRDTEFTIETLKELKELGIRLAVDDFGTGYSSLHYLHSFPIDILKIAKPFIDCIQTESSESAFIYTIVELCRTLGLQTVAEGVEYGSQAEQLRKLRCEWGQGDYLSEPLAVDEMSGLLANGRELSGYAAQVQNTVERREAEWWRRIVGDASAAA